MSFGQCRNVHGEKCGIGTVLLLMLDSQDWFLHGELSGTAIDARCRAPGFDL